MPIDSVINVAITEIFKGSPPPDSSKISLYKKLQIPIFYRNINRDLNCLGGSFSSTFMKVSFNYYLLSDRFTFDNNKLFTHDDTTYFNIQLSNCISGHINKNSYKGLPFTSNEEIERFRKITSADNMNKLTFDFINLYIPLFNRNKDIALVAIEHIALNSSGYGEGDYLILKKDQGNWQVIKDVLWWAK